ncbi:hydroxyacylglutathione hydrolase [Halobacteriovorax marinus]|uniref:hydroxyacylglutathione hydrolase n=1 Tax=Halobacteriovorax marinus TaxID=97084 RepID=A0A1Y5F6H3_9BACT|nr:hydroxyacylglutathione hydrolase [Halobacteriovorax marinus]
MLVHQIYTFSPLRNFSYLIERKDKKAVCIDPFDAKQLISFAKAKGLEIDLIINTHEHFDHICGNAGIVEYYGAKVMAHSNAKGKIPGVDSFLKLGDEVEVLDGKLKVMDTPGHTFAHLCLKYVYKNKTNAVFSGDTLFSAGVGNCHRGGEASTLYKTVSEQFMTLDDEVILYPGHDYIENNLGFTLDREPSNTCACELLKEARSSDTTKMRTTMKMERKINTFLRLNSEEIVTGLSGDVSSEEQVFIRLRELRNNW